MAIVYFTSSFIQESVPSREICSNINMKAILLPIYGESFLKFLSLYKGDEIEDKIHHFNKLISKLD